MHRGGINRLGSIAVAVVVAVALVAVLVVAVTLAEAVAVAMAEGFNGLNATMCICQKIKFSSVCLICQTHYIVYKMSVLCWLEYPN